MKNNRALQVNKGVDEIVTFLDEILVSHSESRLIYRYYGFRSEGTDTKWSQPFKIIFSVAFFEPFTYHIRPMSQHDSPRLKVNHIKKYYELS